MDIGLRGAWHGSLLVLGAMGLGACGGTEPATTAPPEPVPAAPTAPTDPVPTLLMVQAQFIDKKPGPAKLTLWRWHEEQWFDSSIEDPDSSVFHKAIAWRDGILTIGAGALPSDPPKPAKLSHWTWDGSAWQESVLWEKVWSGKFQRIRDMELGDFDGDGADEIAMATHDMGVVAVADEVGRTPAQVLIRWSLQKDFIVLPKSVTPSRIVENAAVFDFELDDAQMSALDELEEGLRLSWDPTLVP